MKFKGLILLRQILVGYLIVSIIIGTMVGIVYYERSRIDEIDLEIYEKERIRKIVHSIYRGLMEMAVLGESVALWEENEMDIYHIHRSHIDSLLTELQGYEGLAKIVQVDTVKVLLSRKEEFLSKIQQVFIQERNDSSLVNELPRLTREATQIREITRKKSGLVGLFGGKKTIYVTPSTKELQELNNQLATAQATKLYKLDRYSDSLWVQNKLLTDKMDSMVRSIDLYLEQVSARRKQNLTDIMNLSYVQVLAEIVILTLLLGYSLFVIHKYTVAKEKGRRKLQKVADENERLLKMSKKIILTVSHDIRGPLGNIMGCVELAMETREKKKRNGYLDNVLYLGHRISHLVNDLMDIYRINEVKDVLNEIPFHLSDLLDRVADNYRMKANNNGLIFKMEQHHTDVTIMGDADKFAQILDNLLTNAVKFTPAGSVHFFSEYKQGLLHIEIRDTGIGMTPEVVEHIFDPFERAAQEINSEGFGLGLYITDGLVRALNGSIEIESEVGRGSIFKLDIPFTETDEVSEEGVLVQGKSFILPKSVLVLDDDPILLKIVDDILTRQGVACTTCSTAKEIVSNLRTHTYDLLLTDIQMPQTDGFGLLKLLRDSDIGNSRTIPIAAMTARGDGNADGYSQAGFCGCIHKPFSKVNFLDFVSSMAKKQEVETSSSYDFSRLTVEAKDAYDMITLLIKESRKNLADLKYALKVINRERMRAVVHRMFPTWEILGVSKVLQDYRDIIKCEDTTEEKVKEWTESVISTLKDMIKEAEKQQKYYTVNEKENIDN